VSSTEVVTTFKKSSFSGSGSANECVEVAETADGGRAVRDSRNPAGGTQFYSASAWGAFVRAVKAGEFGSPV
jgi:hypothetical protein